MVALFLNASSFIYRKRSLVGGLVESFFPREFFFPEEKETEIFPSKMKEKKSSPFLPMTQCVFPA